MAESGSTKLMSVPQETAFQKVGEMLRGAREFLQMPREASKNVLGHALVSLDGAEHRERRRGENRLFTPEALQRYEQEILAPALVEMFDALQPDADEPARARVDVPEFVTDVILAITVRLIGFDRVDLAARQQIHSLIDPLIGAHEIEWADDPAPDTVDRALEAKRLLWTEYVEPAYRRRQAAVRAGGWGGPADLLSVFAEHGDAVDDETVTQECALYVIASVFTTTSTITNAIELMMQWLADHPEDRAAALDESDDFLAACIDETLRLRPPIKPLLLRVAANDGEVGGCPVHAGTTVGVNVPAANVDPEVYPDQPDAFDPRRSPVIEVRRTHYSFGDGPHLCIGKPTVVGDEQAGTHGDAIHIVRAFLAADVREDQTRPKRFAPTARRRYISYPVTVRIDA